MAQGKVGREEGGGMTGSNPLLWDYHDVTDGQARMAELDAALRDEPVGVQDRRIRKMPPSHVEHQMNLEALSRSMHAVQPGYLPEEPIRMREAAAMDWEGYANGLAGVLRKCCDEIHELRGRVEEMEKAK